MGLGLAATQGKGSLPMIQFAPQLIVPVLLTFACPELVGLREHGKTSCFPPPVAQSSIAQSGIFRLETCG